MNNLDNINHYRSCDAGVHIYKRLKNSKYSLYSSYICEDGNYPMPYYDNNSNSRYRNRNNRNYNRESSNDNNQYRQRDKNNNRQNNGWWD